MNIIIIGPDGAGKTALSARLSNYLDMPCIKCSGIDDNKYERAYKYARYYNNRLYDRFYYPDHIVYSGIVDEEIDEQEIAKFNGLENLMLQGEFAVIYLQVPEFKLVRRLQKRGDLYVTPDQIPEMVERYGAFLRNTQLPVLKISGDKPFSEEYLARIKRYLQHVDAYYITRRKCFPRACFWTDYKRGKRI